MLKLTIGIDRRNAGVGLQQEMFHMVNMPETRQNRWMIAHIIINVIMMMTVSVSSQNLTRYLGSNAAIEFRNGVAYPSIWKQQTKTAAGMFWEVTISPFSI